ASFVAGPPGRYEYTVEAWVDRLGSWREDLAKRVDAGWDVSSELLEGAALIRNRTRPASPEDAEELSGAAARLGDAGVASEERAAFALEPALAELLARSSDRQG